MIKASSQIGISITTKDRWDDLKITLSRLHAEGLSSLETIVMDDGSSEPMPAQFHELFPWVRFMRFDKSEGYIPRRNQIMRLLSTPLILGLDDDSYPISGDLDAAGKWLLDHPKVCALALRCIPDESPAATAPGPIAPFPTKSFIGCGNLIKREAFFEIGGYEERLGYSGEELVFALDAARKGYEIHAYFDVIVLHTATPTARNWSARTQLIVRNQTLIPLWFYPFPISIVRALRGGPMQIVRDSWRRKHWKDVLIGWSHAFRRYGAWANRRSRLSWDQFQHVEKLRGPEFI